MRSSMLAALAIFVLSGSYAYANEWPGGPYGHLFGPKIWHTAETSQNVTPTPLRRMVVTPTAHVQNVKEEAARRTYDDILPIRPTDIGGVRTISSQPQRPTPPQHRIVAPNAWSAPLYR